MSNAAFKLTAHVVDVLGNVIGRDQPILLMEKALQLISHLGTDIFKDEDVVFFDPFCKAGELLLACAFTRCRVLSSDQALFDLSMIQKDLYFSNRYFALSPDERHHRLSLRTFLGNANSHDTKYTHIIKDGNYCSEINGKLDKDKFKTEFNNMIEYIKTSTKNKRIVAIGNPPYQESDGGFGKSAKSIYNLFTEALIDSPDISEFILVIPGRWFGGGKGLDQFREQLMTSHKIKNLVYFQNSSHVFPTVDINGGVCYLHYDKRHEGKTTFTDGTHTEVLHLDEFDIISDDPKGYDIVRKILSSWDGQFISDVAMSRNAFGIPTNFFDINDSVDPTKVEAYRCLNKGKEFKFIPKAKILKNVDKIDLWKVAVPKAAGGSKGKRRSTIPLNQIFLIERGTLATETYNIIDCFNTKQEAELLIQYLKTDFARYLLGLRKITQDLPADRWSWVPYVDLSTTWTDETLYSHFGITQTEQEHIRQKIKDWT